MNISYDMKKKNTCKFKKKKDIDCNGITFHRSIAKHHCCTYWLRIYGVFIMLRRTV